MPTHTPGSQGDADRDPDLPEAESPVDADPVIRLAPDAYRKFVAALDAPPRRLDELTAQARQARRLERVDDVAERQDRIPLEGPSQCPSSRREPGSSCPR